MFACGEHEGGGRGACERGEGVVGWGGGEGEGGAWEGGEVVRRRE